MFNIGNILKRAWNILWNYKMLWVFAFLLAISGGAGSTGGGGSGGGSGTRASFPSSGIGDYFNNGNSPQWLNEAENWVEQNINPLFATEASALRTVIWMVAAIFLLAIVIGLLFALVRYPAETAVIRMVDEHENTGVKYRFKQGWKLGWNRRAFRIWLVDLLIGTPATGIVLVLVVLLISFGFKIYRNSGGQALPGGIIGILFVGFFFMAFALLMIVVTLVRNYIVRYVAIEGTGVWESFRRGWVMFKSNLKNTILMGLVLFGVQFVVGIGMMIVFFILIPVYAILAIPGALVAAIPGGIVYGITSLFSSGVVAWIVAAIIALPLFFMVAFSPLSLLGGLVTVFKSNVWTLTYRQLKVTGTPPPVPAESGVPEIASV